jgi:hypothetical protein
MEITLFVGILVILGIIGAVFRPAIEKRDRTRITKLQRSLPPGWMVCPVCKGRKYIWDPNGGNWNPAINAPTGRNVKCYRCGGLGSVQRLYS